MKHTFISLLVLLALPAGTFAQRYNAGHSSGTGGGANTYVGPYAGQNNSASNNTFMGAAAGQFSTGANNTYLGYFAGYWNSSANNTFVGYQAGRRQYSTGGGNTFVGANSGTYNLSGASNTFIGSNAGYDNTSGNYNTLLGAVAGQRNTSGQRNTFLGYASGNHNKTGSDNFFAGAYAGQRNYSGGRNSFVGSGAGLVNFNGNDNTFMGHAAGQANNNGLGNTFLGTSAGLSNTDGSVNVFVGYLAGRGNTTGYGNTMLGHLTTLGSGTLSNAAAIGYRAWVTASNSLVLGAINGQNGSTVNTKVGIGTPAPAYQLHVNASDAAKVGGGSWVVASDKRLKKDINPFTDGLDVLLQMAPVKFRYNGKAGIDTDKQFVGVIAQDMQKIAPYTVGEFTYQDSTGKAENFLDYDPNAITYVLVNAAKELKAENEELKTVNEHLQTRLTNLERELTEIRHLLLKDSPERPSAARLYQNQPNPYHQTTTIKYFLPETTISAQLKVFSAIGSEVFSKELKGKGAGQVQLSAQQFPAGIYVYQLVVDSRIVDSKKLILSR